MNTTTRRRLNSAIPDAARAGRITRALRRVNYTHTGFMLSVAGFIWLLAAATVLIVRTPLNVWTGFLATVALVLLAGRVRIRLGEHRAAPARRPVTGRLRTTTASER